MIPPASRRCVSCSFTDYIYYSACSTPLKSPEFIYSFSHNYLSYIHSVLKIKIVLVRFSTLARIMILFGIVCKFMVTAAHAGHTSKHTRRPQPVTGPSPLYDLNSPAVVFHARALLTGLRGAGQRLRAKGVQPGARGAAWPSSSCGAPTRTSASCGSCACKSRFFTHLNH